MNEILVTAVRISKQFLQCQLYIQSIDESRDRREYQYRIEKSDTKPFGISISLVRVFFFSLGISPGIDPEARAFFVRFWQNSY